MKVGTVGEIRRYPVKSMGGEVVPAADFTAAGLPGDRCWAVRDEIRGGIRGAKKIPALMTLSARSVAPPSEGKSGPVEIDLPDGTTVAASDPDVNGRLSTALDHPVSLWPLLPKDALDHYRRGAPSHEDIEQELRAIFGRAPDEPLPNLSLFPPEIMEFESPPGTYFDAFPLTLLSDASLHEMERRRPESRFDVRRFRPNLVATNVAASAAFPEQEWRGRRLAIGEAVLQVTVECPRCVMVTHGFADLPGDPGVMRALVRESAGNLGVYATVATPGRVAVGDTIELLG